MVIVLKSYLQLLEATEGRRPEGQRRHIPNFEELAEVAGVHPVTLSNIVNNKIKRLSLDVPERIINYMRSLGFPMDTTDFIEFRELPDG